MLHVLPDPSNIYKLNYTFKKICKELKYLHITCGKDIKNYGTYKTQLS